MDDEKLDLIRRLQGVIKKNMGDIEPSDQWLIYHGNNFIGCNVPGMSANLHGYTKDKGYEIILIPDVYSRDPERPERGLWGMVDWKRWAISLGIDGSMVLDDMDDTSESNRYSTDWNTPTIALLKALAWQEGKEIV